MSDCHRRPVYDSLYMVLAIAIGGRVVTADRRLYNGVHGGPLDQLIPLGDRRSSVTPVKTAG